MERFIIKTKAGAEIDLGSVDSVVNRLGQIANAALGNMPDRTSELFEVFPFLNEEPLEDDVVRSIVPVGRQVLAAARRQTDPDATAPEAALNTLARLVAFAKENRGDGKVLSEHGRLGNTANAAQRVPRARPRVGGGKTAASQREP